MDSLPANIIACTPLSGSLVLSNHKITVTPKQGPLYEKNLLGLPFYIYGNMTVS